MAINPSSVTQNGVTAYLSLSGSTVTVEVDSMSYSWRINGTNSGGDHGTYYIKENRNASGSFTASDGHSYAFQVASGGTWSNGAIFTVNFDSGGGDSGGGGDTSASSHTLHINQGEGTIIKVERTWSDIGSKGYLSDGDTIYYPADRFQITAEPLEGYEIDYYDSDDGEQLPFMMENLTKPYAGEPYQLLYAADATISSTASAISTVHIYNNSDKEWYRYTAFIYDKDSGWERCTPYVYNGSSKEWDRYS